jgi:hypothetical protein
MRNTILITAGMALSLSSMTAHAIQFPTLDPAYVQEIYTGPLAGGPGMAWTTGGAMLTRDGSKIYEYSLTQNLVHQGTNVHNYITHAISGLNSSGYGMTNGLDGYIYTTTASGLQRFDPGNWASAAQNLGGTVGGQGYGIHVRPDGTIAYVAGANTNEIYIYSPSANTNTLIYTASGLIDDIATDSAGNLALAGQVNKDLTIINGSGAVLNSFATAHYADGLAFGDGINTNCVFANNNDGTITRFTYAAGYVGAPSTFDIATGSGSYGDLAEVGPDCAFYVSQNENGSYHGATPGVGTNWDNGVTNAENSITRISLKDGSCGFYHLDPVPEPTSFLAVGAGVAYLIRVRKRSTK